MELLDHIPADIMSCSVMALDSTLTKISSVNFVSIHWLAFWCKMASDSHQQEMVS